MIIKTKDGWKELGSSVTLYGSGPKNSVSEGHCFHWFSAQKRGDVSGVVRVESAAKYEAKQQAIFMVHALTRIVSKAHPVGFKAHEEVCNGRGSHCEAHCPLMEGFEAYHELAHA